MLLSWWCRTRFEVLFLIHDLLKPWVPQPRSRGSDALGGAAIIEYPLDTAGPNIGEEGEEIGFSIKIGVTN